MAFFPREVSAGLTDLQADALEKVILIHSTTQSALIRRAVNEMLLRDGWISMDQLLSDDKPRSNGNKNSHPV